jgi:site-specific DNA recombinase
VVEQIKCIGGDPALVAATLTESQKQAREEVGRLESERRSLERQFRRDNAEILKLTTDRSEAAIARLADLQDRTTAAERRLTEVKEEIIALERGIVDEGDAAHALAEFDPVWEALSPREQARVIDLLIDRIDFDGASGRISITFHPSGIKAFAEEQAA